MFNLTSDDCSIHIINPSLWIMIQHYSPLCTFINPLSPSIASHPPASRSINHQPTGRCTPFSRLSWLWCPTIGPSTTATDFHRPPMTSRSWASTRPGRAPQAAVFCCNSCNCCSPWFVGWTSPAELIVFRVEIISWWSQYHEWVMNGWF